jgi:hypothetical protein
LKILLEKYKIQNSSPLLSIVINVYCNDLLNLRKVRRNGTCSTHERDGIAWKILVDKMKGKRTLETRRGRCGNINVCLKELEIEGVDRMGLARDRNQWRAFVNDKYTFGFHKRRYTSGLVERLSASQE